MKNTGGWVDPGLTLATRAPQESRNKCFVSTDHRFLSSSSKAQAYYQRKCLRRNLSDGDEKMEPLWNEIRIKCSGKGTGMTGD